MKHAIGLTTPGLFASTALARAVGACFESPVLRGATLASALALGAVASAQAATYTVTNTNSTGPGSLAWAIDEVRDARDISAVIVFAASVSGTIEWPTGYRRDLYGDVRIQGPGPERVTVRNLRLNLYAGYEDVENLTIEGLQTENSHFTSANSDHTGAASVTVRNCVMKNGSVSGWSVSVSNSQLSDSGVESGYLNGGGVTEVVDSSVVNGEVIGSDVTLINSVVTGNDRYGVSVEVGYSGANLLVSNSIVAGHSLAGIRVLDRNATVHVESSVIANNGADGIFFDIGYVYEDYRYATQFNLTVTNSTISGNGQRAIRGKTGDFRVDSGESVDPTSPSVVEIDNSTFVGNGGGVEVILGNGGRLSSNSRITRTTIAGNAAERGGGVSVVRAATNTVVGSASVIAFDSTLIAKNTASVAGPDLYTDVPGFTFKANYSLIQNPAGAPITSTVAGSNITGQDPKLMRLANLGGTTLVRALGAGSPALNKGNPSLAGVPATDQRGTGFPRVAGGRIDIGAFEQQAVDVAPVVMRSLPDVTGNGTPELAALVQSIPTGATTVRVRDALTGAAHWQVTLPGTGEAIDLETLGDVNGNGKRDIAVLRTAPASVAIRDGLTGAAVKTIALTSGFFPKALATLTDVNGNGKPDVAVLGTKAGKSVVELRDSQTGALIKSTTFNSPGTPRDIVALRQQAGNASSAALLGVLMDVRDPTQSDALEIRNALTGALVTRGNVGAGAESMEAVVLPDSNGNSGNEFAVLKSSGEVRVFDLPGFAPMTTMQFLAGETPLHLTTVPDTNGSGVTELAVLSRHQADGALKAEVRDAATGALIKAMDYSSQYRADELVSVPDINNNGVAELSHVGPNSSGVVRATQRDVATGVLSSRVNLVP